MHAVHRPDLQRKARCRRSRAGLRRDLPDSARHFGDLGDPNSDVSKLVRERGGYDLMPEMGYKPVNRYLPPRPRRTEAAALGAAAQLQPLSTDAAGGLLGWIDRLLSN